MLDRQIDRENSETEDFLVLVLNYTEIPVFSVEFAFMYMNPSIC